MDLAHLAEHRSEKDEFFAGSHHSPLPPADRDGFAGLSYYPPRADLVFTVEPRPADGAPVRVQTSDGREREYTRASTVNLEVEGEEVELTLYSTGSPGLFVPFRDRTSGKETYGAGRYLDIDPNPDGTVTIDFNLA